jgi:DNA transformation protein
MKTALRIPVKERSTWANSKVCRTSVRSSSASFTRNGHRHDRRAQKGRSKEAWLRILARDPSACIMRLSALEGAIRGVRWHYLDADVKADLKAFYHQHK